MLLFGHLGITLGVGVVLDRWLVGGRYFNIETAKEENCFQEHGEVRRGTLYHIGKKYLNYIFLLVGALLPDIIDKPVGDIVFYNTFHNGRIFSHTLCFILFLAILGVFIHRRWGKPWGFILCFGSAIHLVLDRMWLNPHTLLWPIYGWNFAKSDSTNFFQWLPTMFHTLVTVSYASVSEIIGFGILVWFVINFVRIEKELPFVRTHLAEKVFKLNARG